MTTTDVAALVEIMVRAGCTRIICDGVTIERPLPPPKDTRAEMVKNDLDRIMAMPEDKRDAALMLRKLGRGG
jgi:hypothetical protein